jgi:cation diffusion facilitator CzcD-associated flavoprotein CzcO
MPTAQSLPAHVATFVIGAGFGGIAVAIKLAEAGHADFLVIDRGPEVGGTWRDNTYPGATCDIPSQLYSFSFALNPNWTRSFSPQPEIQDYLRRVARDAAVLDRFRFGVTFTDARWDDADRRWHIETSAGSLTANLLVAAAGALSEPKRPDIDGIDDFAGELFHSARWNHDYDVTGKRVAVIGTGASAIQIVPEIAKTASRVDVYQRTAPWVMPRRDRTFTRPERLAFRYLPGFQRLTRWLVYLGREATVPLFISRPALGKIAERVSLNHLRRNISDPGLRARLTPNFALGCKRVLISNDWYPALERTNVDLISTGIDRIDAGGVITTDGTRREVDAVIVATGFTPTEPPIAQHIYGRDGRRLSDVWQNSGVQAYKGATVHGFPNLFFIVGPNTVLGHSSMVFMIEAQVEYLLDALRTMHRYALADVEVEVGEQAQYNAALQRRMARTVWSVGGCSSWYLDKHGRNVTLWPRSTVAFRRMTARFDLAAYRSTAQPRVIGTWGMPSSTYSAPLRTNPNRAYQPSKWA